MIDRDYIEKRDLWQAYYDAFSSEAGKKVLEDLETACLINVFTTYGEDMVFNEGKRCIGNYIKHQIKQYEKEVLNGNGNR